jgi:hypothetical protein
MRMPVDGSEDGEAKEQSEDANYGTRDGDRQIEPTDAFKPIRFHKRCKSYAVTLHHKVSPVKAALSLLSPV